MMTVVYRVIDFIEDVWDVLMANIFELILFGAFAWVLFR